MEDTPRLAKEPWLAACLSLYFPFLGHFYAGAWGLGLMFLAGWLVFPAGFLWAVFCPSGKLWVAVLMIGYVLALVVAAVFTAHRAAKRRNTAEAEAFRRGRRDPYLAVFIAEFAPGVGHVYLDRPVLGAVILLVFGAAWLAIWTVPALVCHRVPWVLMVSSIPSSALGAGIILWTWCVAPPDRRTGRAGIAALVVLAAFCGPGVCSGLSALRYFVVEGFAVPVASMSPTIEWGDKVFAWKLGFQPRRGDIVAFRSPRDCSVKYVKRVAALEGETVEIKDGGIYVNGRRLTDGVFGRLEYTIERAPDGQTFGAEGEPFTVPQGHIYVLGDNSSRSYDSRYFGPVPLSDVIGRVYKRYWPPSRAGPLD